MNILGKSVSIAIVAILVSAGLVSAGLLSYYGKITTTVEVQQSVVVDGNEDCEALIADEIPESAPGGETFCFKHTLTNRASISATVNFETSPEYEGITTTYFEPLEYLQNYEVPIDGSDSPLVVTVEDGECHVTWTFDFPVENWTGDGNLNVGLVIALDGDGNGPAFQIHNTDSNDMTLENGTPLVAGTWAMSPWGPTIGDGWFGWHGDMNTLVTELDWVSATGNRNVPHGDGILQISISKHILCEDFHWAASPTVGSGFWDAYDVTMQIPPAFGWSTPIVDMGVPNYEYAQVLGAVTSITIQSRATVDFYICYSFDIAIAPGTYIITTKVVPA